MIDRERLVRRFLRYAAVDTQSDPASVSCPSTPGQRTLAGMLVKDLIEAGCTDVSMDSNGYVTGTLEANVSEPLPVIGLIAHMDTSPDFSGKNVNPRIIANYNGESIPLDPLGQWVLRPEEFPDLLNYVGDDLIVTDGTTLLGADDKAGIAEIVEALTCIASHPGIPHGRIRVGFTPDEEIGRGADRFDVENFGADFAYTVDGGGLGELEYENFNAAGVQVRIQGRNVHPGTARNRMVNALQLAVEFHSRLPADERPEHTEGYQGFYHLTRLDGTVESARMEYILRDHDRQSFESRKEFLIKLVAELNESRNPGKIECTIRDQYYNMREKIEPVFHIVELASRAMKQSGVEPVIIPIRGGTDGSKLSYMGLPTPNLFSGGHNYHGRFEFIPVGSMVKATEVLIHIIQNPD